MRALKYNCHLITFCLSIFLIAGCKKGEEKVIKVYLNTPFQMSPNQRCVLVDTVHLSGSNSTTVKNTVWFSVASINEDRDMGSVCDQSTGGSIGIKTLATVNGVDSAVCEQYIPGCVGENEWNPYLNTNAPRCKIYDSLDLCLVKVDPTNFIPENENEYRFKYIFKRPRK